VKTSRGPKLAALKQRTASSTFSLQISDQGECRGRLLLVTFLGEARKVTALRHEQFVAKIPLHSTRPFDWLRPRMTAVEQERY